MRSKRVALFPLGAVFAVATVACSSTTTGTAAGPEGGGGGGLTGDGNACLKNGTWRLSQTLAAGSDPPCPPGEGVSTKNETAGVAEDTIPCQPGCVCDGGTDKAACSLWFKSTCNDTDNGTTSTTDCSMKQTSGTKVAGTCEIAVTAATTVRCKYDLTYDWVQP